MSGDGSADGSPHHARTDEQDYAEGQSGARDVVGQSVPAACATSANHRQVRLEGEYMSIRGDSAIAMSMAAALLVVYSVSTGTPPGGDTAPNVLLAANIIEKGQVSFTPSEWPVFFKWVPNFGNRQGVYLAVLDDATLDGVPARYLYEHDLLTPIPESGLTPTTLKTETGERAYVTIYGPGAALSALPILAAVRIASGDLLSAQEALWYGAKFAAALCVAASAAFVYLIARAWLDGRRSALLALAYGLGTCVWSVSSQGLWQHSPNELFLGAGTWAFVRGRGLRTAALSGFCLALATACRPTSAIFVAAIGAYLLWTNWRAAVAFCAATVPVWIALGIYNLRTVGSALMSAQGAVALSGSTWSTPLPEGLTGLLISPSRGLLVFSPFLVFAGMGAVRAWRSARYATLRPLTVAVAATLIVHAKWACWWGGHSFGYRIIVDLALALVLLIVPALDWITAGSVRRSAFTALVAWSVLIQVFGVFVDDGSWSAGERFMFYVPDGHAVVATRAEARRIAAATGLRYHAPEQHNVDDDRYYGRLWSISDSELVRCVSHFREVRLNRQLNAASALARWRTSP